jgi:uncharacterized protein
MLYAIYCKDKPGHLQTRLDNRSAHVEYLKRFEAQHVCIGPLLSDDGQSMIGSLLVLDFADRQAAETFAADDPMPGPACSRASRSHRSATSFHKLERGYA